MLLSILVFLSGEVANYQEEQKQPPVICDSGYKMTKTAEGWKCVEVSNEK